MINDVYTAIYTLLAKDEQLVKMLASFQGAPAIVTAPEIPYELWKEYPAIFIRAEHTSDMDTLATREMRAVFKIEVYARRTPSVTALQSIADRVYEVLHHHIPVALNKTYIYGWVCSGPSAASPYDMLSECDTQSVTLTTFVQFLFL